MPQVAFDPESHPEARAMLAGLDRELSTINFMKLEYFAGNRGVLWDAVINRVARALILNVLKHSKYNKVKAANALGINRNTLYKMMKRFGIEDQKERD